MTVLLPLRERAWSPGEACPEGDDGIACDAGTAVLVRPYYPAGEDDRARERERVRDWQDSERERWRRHALAFTLRRAAEGSVRAVCADASTPKTMPGGGRWSR
ncbi:hypothetical protein AB0D49_21585 [Streptomyces sp. NPDC048290]|uniref:hypothetical protein n=1 Tax=Streptomyces sp. NPDC048290 TaxID=3155811 RepID=UPI003422907D